jgi:hypothetical protein
VLAVQEAAAKADVDQDWLRHALARKATRGREASSKLLTGAEASTVIDFATEIADGDWKVVVAGEDPPYAVLERP